MVIIMRCFLNVNKENEIAWSPDSITSKKDLTVDIVDEKGNVTESSVVISFGEHYQPYRSDAKTYMDCKLDDGRIVRLYYSNVDYKGEIDGEVVDDIFDGLIYAG